MEYCKQEGSYFIHTTYTSDSSLEWDSDSVSFDKVRYSPTEGDDYMMEQVPLHVLPMKILTSCIRKDTDV